jgi:hypothetical protein
VHMPNRPTVHALLQAALHRVPGRSLSTAGPRCSGR